MHLEMAASAMISVRPRSRFIGGQGRKDELLTPIRLQESCAPAGLITVRPVLYDSSHEEIEPTIEPRPSQIPSRLLGSVPPLSRLAVSLLLLYPPFLDMTSTLRAQPPGLFGPTTTPQLFNRAETLQLADLHRVLVRIFRPPALFDPHHQS